MFNGGGKEASEGGASWSGEGLGRVIHTLTARLYVGSEAESQCLPGSVPSDFSLLSSDFADKTVENTDSGRRQFLFFFLSLVFSLGLSGL